jgi:hypothetical protein
MNKKHLTVAIGAGLLALGIPSVSLAQGTAASGPFADVPADHWAYQSVDTLQKAGIVIGYPDGTYGGKRAMTRYEFAVAIARLMPLLNNKPDLSIYATKDDLAAARQDLEQKLQANSDAIDALRKLVDEFGPELQKLGQDVAAIKDRLDALEARVAAVEEEQRRVKFNGVLNLIAEGDATTKGVGFMDQNGNGVGVGHDNGHILRNTDVKNDFVLAIRGKVSDVATANVKLDFGNYLDSINNTAAGGALSAGGAGGFTVPAGSLTAASQQTTVWEANLATPVNLGPLGGADLVAGRFGNQETPYTLKQIDVDVYTYLAQTDSGDITTDGAKVNLNLGPAKVNAWAGKFSAIPFSQPYAGPGPGTRGGLALQALPGGLIFSSTATALQQGAGVRATLGNIVGGTLGVNYEQFGIANPVGSGIAPPIDPNRGVPYNVLSVYGLDFNGAFPIIGNSIGHGLTLDASYTIAPTGSNSRGTNDVSKGQRYTATDDQIGLTFGALSLKGGYQFVGPDFTAPGSWGKLGAWTNPSNIEGGVASAKYILSPKLTLKGEYNSYKAAYGVNANGTALSSPLQQGDKVSRYQVGAGYGLTSNYDVDLGYEAVDWTIGNHFGFPAGKPTQSFITIGLGHTFNPNASFKLLYQIVQYKDKNTNFDGGVGDTTGNVAVGQFQVKF